MAGHRRWNVFLMLQLTLLAMTATQLPVAVATTAHVQHHQHQHQHHHLHERATSFASGVELRILPIGDSITNGTHWSSDAGGYRSRLYKLMKDKFSNTIHMVGHYTNGAPFAEDHHEGHSGFFVRQIEDASNYGIYSGPNIILVHAGTNDMDHGAPKNGIPDLEHLINTLLDKNPDAVVFVAQVIPSKTQLTDSEITRFNGDIANVLMPQFKGQKVVLVDMNTGFSKSNIRDDLHPNDNGYQDMASRWMKAITDNEKLISKPGKATTPPAGSGTRQRCKADPLWRGVVEIASGARVATDDGPFFQNWGSPIKVVDGQCPLAQLHFMDLDGDGLKDYACVEPKTGNMLVRLSKPDSTGKIGKWTAFPNYAAQPNPPLDGRSVTFADINGDGRDDYIYIDPNDGAIFSWINKGAPNDGDPWNWGPKTRITGGFNATINNTQLVDLDGDGRADLCHINLNDGTVEAWNNGSGDDVPDFSPLGTIVSSAIAVRAGKIIFADFTGNGRADYTALQKDGAVSGLLNRLQEMVIAPRWSGTNTFADGPNGATLDNVRLVDLTGDGLVDYLVIDPKTGAVTMRENQGDGGRYQRGDGVFLADLDGDGALDYIWVSLDREIYGYLNVGKGTNSWKNLGLMITPDVTRDRMHFAKMTDSGRADLVAVQPSGVVTWWRNTGGAGGKWFEFVDYIASGAPETMKNKFGWKFDYTRVHFADLDGDGLDDFLYVNNQGETAMWKHLSSGKNAWGVPVLVADGPSLDPNGDGVKKHVLGRQIQFADVDGDGKVDYNVVGTVSGRTWTWHNLGFRSDGSIRWSTPLIFADGPGAGRRGQGVIIGDITGEGRADYVSIDPDTARANFWKNDCAIETLPTDGPCRWDPDDSNAWQLSSAADLVASYLANHDNVNWFAQADRAYYGQGGLVCYTIDGSCPEVDQCGNDFNPVAWFYARQMASRVQSAFIYASDAVGKRSVVNLASLDSMLDDFEWHQPHDDSTISKVFSSLSSAIGLAGAVSTGGASTVLGAGGSIFGLFGGIASNQASATSETESKNIKDIKTRCEKYISDTLERVNKALATTLKALFYGDPASMPTLKQAYSQLVKSGLISQSSQKNLISQVLDGGEFLIPPVESDIRTAFERGFNDTLAGILGQTMTGFHYFVVDVSQGRKDTCDKVPSARFVDDTCLFLAVRPNSDDYAADIKTDMIDKMENKYHLQLSDLLKNVKDCNNKKVDPSNLALPNGRSRYPDCFFGLPYVLATNVVYPLYNSYLGGLSTRIRNGKDLPSWFMESEFDLWDTPWCASGGKC